MSVVTSARKSSVSFRSAKSKLVRFQINYDLKSLLVGFLNEKNQADYDELVCRIRDGGFEIQDGDLVELLREARNCVSVLDESLHHFVRVILILKWAHRSDEVVKEYQGFLLDLCSTHPYYTKFAIDQLVLNFMSDTEPSEAEDCTPGAEEEIVFSRVHEAVKMLLQVIPMCEGLLVASVINNYPYIKRSAHHQETYILNVLCIIQYRPYLRQDFLSLIINKLLALDVQAPRDEIVEADLELVENKENNSNVFQMDEDTEENNSGNKLEGMSHPIANILDTCLMVVFRFIYSECHNNDSELDWEKAKSLYADLTSVFEKIILPTHACYHVQFLIFYFISFKNSLAYSFLKLLWRKVINVTGPPVIRQASVSYIASLLSRAKFIPISILMEFLTTISSWVHSYISNQDAADVNYSCRVHGVFYSTCQALFYLIAFRHRDLVNHNRGLKFLQGLNLAKIVTCRLNPLRVCLPPVVSNFAAVTRHYQLVYCYSIIEHNARNNLPRVYRDSTGAATTTEQVYLDTFFPFDPYMLHRSSKLIVSLYREYEGPTPSEDNDMKQEFKPKSKDDDDDFLMEQSSGNSSLSFSYGTSPGFLQA